MSSLRYLQANKGYIQIIEYRIYSEKEETGGNKGVQHEQPETRARGSSLGKVSHAPGLGQFTARDLEQVDDPDLEMAREVVYLDCSNILSRPKKRRKKKKKKYNIVKVLEY